MATCKSCNKSINANYYCMSGKAVRRDSIEAGSISPTEGRDNMKSENEIFPVLPDHGICNNRFIIRLSNNIKYEIEQKSRCVELA